MFLLVCCQIDEMFGSTSVNGKENGSAASTSQPNRVCTLHHTSVQKKRSYFRCAVQLFYCSLCLVVTQMSLTLEEKQRLAKEQEQAAKLRSQQPLAPQTIKPPSTSSSQVKSANTSPKQRFSCHAALWREKN